MVPACDYTQCHAVLKSPVMNEIMINKKHDFSRNFLRWFKTLTYEVYSQLKSSGFDLGVTFVVEGIPVPFNFGQDMSKEEFEQTKKMIDEGKFEQVNESSMMDYASRHESASTVQAWSACMRDMAETCRAVTPGQIIYEVERHGNDIALTIKYLKVSEEPWPKVISFDVPDNVECESGCLQTGDEIKSQRLITFKVNGTGTGYIAIQTDRGEPFKYFVRPTISTKQYDKALWALMDYCEEKFQQQFPNSLFRISIPFLDIENEDSVSVALILWPDFDSSHSFRPIRTNLETFALSEPNVDSGLQICTSRPIAPPAHHFCISMYEVRNVIENAINNA